MRALARKTEGVRRGPRSGRIGPVDQFEQRTPERKRRPRATLTMEADPWSAFPAKAGIQPLSKSQNPLAAFWIPACAGNTADKPRPYIGLT